MNIHNSLFNLFSGIATVIKNNAENNNLITLNEFPLLIVNVKNEKDYRVKSLIDKSIMYASCVDLDGVTSIEHYVFLDCSNLALTSLPEGIISIKDSAFNYCSNLALTSLPESLTTIGNYAFSRCSNLKSITFKGTPTTISSTAFYNCNNLTTINVPWSEGEVAGAPWGATNATINYNYTGE